ncbi:hypothetical protein C8Q76DRAFT_793128 [Earliella scabrosa]|nr:hypothetical protein C8Q76DRAFT_793128 [Earliella scabrosa]
MPPRKKPRMTTSDSSVQVTRPATRGAVPKQPYFAPTMRRRSKIPLDGILGALLDLPVEVELEVFAYMQLSDLYNLARTCRRFRAFFLHPSNKRLWVAALRNSDDLPPCPPFMSEPAFAHLLFSTHCQACGEGPVKRSQWFWFRRLCEGCAMEQSYSRDTASRKLEELNLSQYPKMSWAREPFYLPFYLFNLDHCGERRGNLGDRRVCRAELDKLVDDYLAAPAGSNIHQHRSQLLHARLAEKDQRDKFAVKCSDWYELLQRAREAKLRAKCKLWLSQFLRRLRNDGWGAELLFLDKMGPSASHRFSGLAVATKLTEEGYEKARKAVTPYLKRVRTVRLEREHKAAICSRLRDLYHAMLQYIEPLPITAKMVNRPSLMDLALTDTCRALCEAPTSEPVTIEHFTNVLPSMITRWETERKREFTEFLRFYLPDVPEDIDITELAIAVFVCFHGYNPSPGRDGTICIWRFPEVLGHSCLHSGGVKDRALNHNDTYVTIAKDVSSALAWSKARSVFWYEDRCWDSHLAPIKDHAGAIIGMMRLIVRALGLDPLRATYQELELCDRRVRCLVCAEEGREEYVYTWEAALNHSIGGPADRRLVFDPVTGAFVASTHDVWELVSEEAMDLVRPLEDEAHGMWVSDLNSFQHDWVCAMCGDRARGHDMIKHLHDEHDMDDSDECTGKVFLDPTTRKKCGGTLMRVPVLYPVLESHSEVGVDTR